MKNESTGWRFVSPICVLMVALVVALSLAGCKGTEAELPGKRVESAATTATRDEGQPEDAQASDPDSEARGEAAASSSSTASDVDAQVKKKVASMTLEQKVAQMFIVAPESLESAAVVTAADEYTKQGVIDHPVGGVCYANQNLLSEGQVKEMLATMQTYSNEASGLPLLLCIDEESAAAPQIGGVPIATAAKIDDIRAIGDAGDAALAADYASNLSKYLKPLGFNFSLDPVCDIDNGATGIAYQGVFGATAQQVTPLVEAQLTAFDKAGMITCAKHFPGTGVALGTAIGSSMSTNSTIDQLRAEEYLPFKAAIEKDVPFVMVGSILTPNATTDGVPASLSKQMVTNELRGELGFDGVIVTDDISVGAAPATYGPSTLGVEAVKAGVDMIYKPADFASTYQGIVDAVRSGQIEEARIDESVERIVRAKAALKTA